METRDYAAELAQMKAERKAARALGMKQVRQARWVAAKRARAAKARAARAAQKVARRDAPFVEAMARVEARAEFRAFLDVIAECVSDADEAVISTLVEP